MPQVNEISWFSILMIVVFMFFLSVLKIFFLLSKEKTSSFSILPYSHIMVF